MSELDTCETNVDASCELRTHRRRRGINSNCQRTPCRTEYAKLGEDGERQDAARCQAGERARNQENHESGGDDWQEHRNDEYSDRLWPSLLPIAHSLVAISRAAASSARSPRGGIRLLAPHGPRSRKRPSRRMRLRWANCISTFSGGDKRPRIPVSKREPGQRRGRLRAEYAESCGRPHAGSNVA